MLTNMNSSTLTIFFFFEWTVKKIQLISKNEKENPLHFFVFSKYFTAQCEKTVKQ